MLVLKINLFGKPNAKMRTLNNPAYTFTYCTCMEVTLWGYFSNFNTFEPNFLLLDAFTGNFFNP
jgi:hypothetical protein